MGIGNIKIALHMPAILTAINISNEVGLINKIYATSCMALCVYIHMYIHIYSGVVWRVFY